MNFSNLKSRLLRLEKAHGLRRPQVCVVWYDATQGYPAPGSPIWDNRYDVGNLELATPFADDGTAGVLFVFGCVPSAEAWEALAVKQQRELKRAVRD